MNLLRAFYESQWWIPMIALCALAVTFALLRNISSQDKTLPPPESRCSKGKDLFIASGGRH